MHRHHVLVEAAEGDERIGAHEEAMKLDLLGLARHELGEHHLGIGVLDHVARGVEHSRAVDLDDVAVRAGVVHARVVERSRRDPVHRRDGRCRMDVGGILEL